MNKTDTHPAPSALNPQYQALRVLWTGDRIEAARCSSLENCRDLVRLDLQAQRSRDNHRSIKYYLIREVTTSHQIETIALNPEGSVICNRA